MRNLFYFSLSLCVCKIIVGSIWINEQAEFGLSLFDYWRIIQTKAHWSTEPKYRWFISTGIIRMETKAKAKKKHTRKTQTLWTVEYTREYNLCCWLDGWLVDWLVSVCFRLVLVFNSQAKTRHYVHIYWNLVRCSVSVSPLSFFCLLENSHVVYIEEFRIKYSIHAGITRASVQLLSVLPAFCSNFRQCTRTHTTITMHTNIDKHESILSIHHPGEFQKRAKMHTNV